MIRLNIGCGKSPVKEYTNYDNSPTLKLTRRPIRLAILRAIGFVDAKKMEYIRFLAESDIRWANASKHIPHRDNEVDLLYTSHMIEHMDRREAQSFVTEAFRVIKPGGMIRIVLPDLKQQIEEYNETGDADELVRKTLLAQPRPRTIHERILAATIGHRDHLWMYDPTSISKLLLKHGFQNPVSLPPGETTCPYVGDLNLRERDPGSLYVEATKPTNS